MAASRSHPAAAPPSETSLAYRIGSVFLLRRTWIVIGLVWASVYAVAGRHSMNPDGMSYIDMASEAAQGRWDALVNLYWSPGYPAFLAILMRIFRPDPAAVYPLVHFANLIIFAAVLGTFGFFWKHFCMRTMTNERILIPFGYAIFLWHIIELIGLTAVSPDLCIAGVCFLAAGIVCRANASIGSLIALGVALAAGFYFKAAGLPIGLLALVVLWIAPPAGFSRRNVAWAAAVFVIAITPLIATFSLASGRLTTGDAGKLNYIWFVNRFHIYTGWTEAGDYGTPAHPPRTLLTEPTVLEFVPADGRGTFPLWSDPAFRWEGSRVRFQWERQRAALHFNALIYRDTVTFMNGLIAGMALLLVLGFLDRKSTFRRPDWRALWNWQILWPFGVMAMYCVVHVEPRFVASFFVLLWAAIYRLLLPLVKRAARAVILGTVAATMVLPSLVVAAAVGRFALASPKPGYQVTAETLAGMGITRGDRVAVVGEAFEAYYAQFAGLKIVAQIPDVEEFRRTDAAGVERVAQQLRIAGVKAIVAPEPPLEKSSWRAVPADGAQNLFVLMVNSPQ